MRTLVSLVLGTFFLVASGAVYAQQASPASRAATVVYSAALGSSSTAAEFFWPGAAQNNGDLTGLHEVDSAAECQTGTFECGSTCCSSDVVCCRAREQAASYCAPDGRDCPW